MTRREWLTWAASAAWHPAAIRAAQPPRPPEDDPTALTVAGLARAYGERRLTPIDVTGAYLAAIDREDGALGAYVTVARERAVDETRRLLLRASALGTEPPLFGVPVAHKDLFATRGVRTTGGSRLHERWVPDEDADLVAAFTGAGAVLLGKTNTHELGGGVTTINPFFGTTHNPHDPTRIAGGSSGGSAAAVAARLALVATGSDTGGSVRIPAALCGCVGLKPTFGLLPTGGLLGACPTFDHAGLLTRTAEDAALVLAAVAPSGTGAPRGEAFLTRFRAAVERGLHGGRLGVARAYFCAGLDPGVAAAFDEALRTLSAAGARLADVDLGITAETYGGLFDPIAVSEIRATYRADWAARPEAFSRDFAAVFQGPPIPETALAAARVAREAFERRVATVLDEVDLLVMPTVPVTAPPIAGPIDGMRILRNTWAFNAARVPAVSVPCGNGAGGVPVGLQLVGPRFAEPELLAAAGAIERRLPLAAAASAIERRLPLAAAASAIERRLPLAAAARR
ncbi:MAG: amidase [Vicinamibacterales bacterium]